MSENVRAYLFFLQTTPCFTHGVCYCSCLFLSIDGDGDDFDYDDDDDVHHVTIHCADSTQICVLYWNFVPPERKTSTKDQQTNNQQPATVKNCIHLKKSLLIFIFTHTKIEMKIKPNHIVGVSLKSNVCSFFLLNCLTVLLQTSRKVPVSSTKQ